MSFNEVNYGRQQKKSLRTALRNTFINNLGLGGQKYVELAVDEVLDIVENYQVPGERLTKGQTIWTAVAADGKHAHGGRLEDTPMESVVLTTVSEEDTEARKNGTGVIEVRKQKIERLCHEAYEQGAVLGLLDIAQLLNVHRDTVSRKIGEIEADQEALLPTRGTIHDLGAKVTHKAEIVKKVEVEKRAPPDVARETNHSLKSVDRYLNDFERVQALAETQSVREIAFVTDLSISLVEEYVELVDLLDSPGGGE